MPALVSEPGRLVHTAAEIGIDDFQAERSPDRMYRSTPLRGLFARSKGGFYHDGRFPTRADVVNHYDRHFTLGLDKQGNKDLVEYLKSLWLVTGVIGPASPARRGQHGHGAGLPRVP